MNILFTCAGRRNYLLEYFNEINEVRTIACDASKFAPALYAAHDFFIVPEVYDNDYIPILIKEAKSRNIHAIISLNDIELPVLAQHKSEFQKKGIQVIVSDPEIIDLCFDKYKTVDFTRNLPVKSIPTFLNPEEALEYQKTDPNCKFVIKPRWGTASIGIEYPQNNDELLEKYSRTKKKLLDSFLKTISSTDYKNCVMIQKLIQGREYGIDVVNNLNAQYAATLVRRKIEMRSGETDKAETEHHQRLIEIGEEIGTRLKHIGNLDCDLFIENDDVYLLEMNPRFGGGYPFMHFAGANLPKALVEWLKGKTTPRNIFHYKENAVAAKVNKIVPLRICKNVYIVGAGGFGREIESWVDQSEVFNECYSLIGFLDDDISALDGYPSDLKVMGTIDDFKFSEDDYVILGIAKPEIKKQIIERLSGKVRFLSFVFGNTIMGNHIQIGQGSIIAPNCVLSTNIKIGDFVVLNIGTQVGHDTCVADYTSVMANVDISGNIEIGEEAYIGSNTTIVPGRKIGKQVKINAGSIVITDPPDNSFAFGNPARFIKRQNHD